MGCSNKKNLAIGLVATVRVCVCVNFALGRIISPDGSYEGRKRRFVDVYIWEDITSLYEKVDDRAPAGGAACFQPMPSFWGAHPLLAWSDWLDGKLFRIVNGRWGNWWTDILGWPREHTARKLGEMHFAANCWSKYVVSHECLHTVIMLARDTKQLDEIERDVRGPGYYEISPEEDFCTMHQSLFADVYQFLREYAPDGELHK